MEFISAIIVIAFIGLVLLIPLALTVGGLGLFVSAIYSIRDSLKGNKNGKA